MSAFVYGTLMFPEVLHALIDRVPRMEPAVIQGYQRYRIRGQVFPGTIRAAASSRVQGLVLFDLQPQELEVLDEFEGEEYRKEAVAARLLGTPAQRGASSSSEGGEGGAEVDTIVYIWQDSLRGHLYGEWDPQEFRDQELERYVHMCARFAADVQAQLGWKGAFEPSSSSVPSSSPEQGGAPAAPAAPGEQP